jgi:hypothetical protein
MAKDKYELKVPNTRLEMIRADGTTMRLEQGEQREPRDDEEAMMLAAHPSVKLVDKGGK